MDRNKDILLLQIAFTSSKVDFRPVFAPTDPQISHFSRETLLRRITVFGVRSYPPVYFGPEYPPGFLDEEKNGDPHQNRNPPAAK